MRMAGKTGTSQVRNITAAERARGVHQQRRSAVGTARPCAVREFCPFDNPKYAVAVVVEHGGGGSTAAAPIARDITLQALYEGDPPLSAYPTKDRGRIKTQQEELRASARQAATDGSDRA